MGIVSEEHLALLTIPTRAAMCSSLVESEDSLCSEAARLKGSQLWRCHQRRHQQERRTPWL